MERKYAKFSVRLPDDLNEYINETAADMGMSKNGFILFLIQMWKQEREDTTASILRGVKVLEENEKNSTQNKA